MFPSVIADPTADGIGVDAHLFGDLRSGTILLKDILDGLFPHFGGILAIVTWHVFLPLVYEYDTPTERIP